MNRRVVMAVARLELAEVRRSRWFVVCGSLYAILAALFLVIGLRESAVLEFTGTGRVLASLGHALVVCLPLFALAGTAPVITRAREAGTLELLFSQPIARADYLLAITIVRVAALVAPLAIVLPATALVGRVGFGQSIPWGFLIRALVVSTALIWAFVGLGMAISTWIREPARATVYLLLIWALAVALLDFGLAGLMLQWRLRPDAVFLIAAMNPVQAARLALLASADRSLDTLGPIGVFLSGTLGTRGLMTAGVLWPAIVGTTAWLAARRSLRRADVI